ncbi:MTH538 TIR-like domain [Malonomonas rubra DSM 5091]|uniref:MTH538 TIR-like domain n=1 Tax=Malonomonas rubra DSM 5091 TaxID=1122189 RepID=A0A1M6KWT5_MALRU|nr:TIR domain-containing protein [Malonomonas rubra]SHJ63417.1 MTH538 TIR-like domain [Malonomonas rubra DSM 5091]
MRKVFFSFHYSKDIRRVVQVRNSWVVRNSGESQPFLDKADWETIKRSGKKSIENWIEKQLKGTSVTVVLIGAETASREWVGYEIKRSYELGKGIVGISVVSQRLVE